MAKTGIYFAVGKLPVDYPPTVALTAFSRTVARGHGNGDRCCPVRHTTQEGLYYFCAIVTVSLARIGKETVKTYLRK